MSTVRYNNDEERQPQEFHAHQFQLPQKQNFFRRHTWKILLIIVVIIVVLWCVRVQYGECLYECATSRKREAFNDAIELSNYSMENGNDILDRYFKSCTNFPQDIAQYRQHSIFQ